MAHMTTLDDLNGRLFASVPEVASLLRRDERTIRRGIEAGTIPATRAGATWSIPVSWLRERAGVAGPAAVAPDFDAMADAIADKVEARLAKMLARAVGVSDGAEAG